MRASRNGVASKQGRYIQRLAIALAHARAFAKIASASTRHSSLPFSCFIFVPPAYAGGSDLLVPHPSSLVTSFCFMFVPPAYAGGSDLSLVPRHCLFTH